MTFPFHFPDRFSNLAKIIILLVLALALQACSTVKVAYNQATTLGYLYLDGYMDFNDVQGVQAKTELNRFQAWHRQTQLPAYIGLLQKVQQQMPQDISAAQACEVFAEVRQKAQIMVDYANASATSVATLFTQQQLDAMQRKFAKSNATWREDFVDASARDVFEKRQSSAVKRTNMLYGSTNDRQRSLIVQHIEKSQFRPAQSYAERQRRQKDVLQTLGKVVANPQDTVASQQELRGLLARTVVSPDTTYRTYQERAIEEGCANFAELHNSATPEQRKKAVAVLAGYEQDFKVLASQK